MTVRGTPCERIPARNESLCPQAPLQSEGPPPFKTYPRDLNWTTTHGIVAKARRVPVPSVQSRDARLCCYRRVLRCSVPRNPKCLLSPVWHLISSTLPASSRRGFAAPFDSAPASQDPPFGCSFPFCLCSAGSSSLNRHGAVAAVAEQKKGGRCAACLR
ncbi:hypothetical protein LZ32DRAFT_221144 [Colletotrichum eremochloae]|nr:hypothetical protein LZ32DRAFT_221144 [Colletotrichum eremochloae]